MGQVRKDANEKVIQIAFGDNEWRYLSSEGRIFKERIDDNGKNYWEELKTPLDAQTTSVPVKEIT